MSDFEQIIGAVSDEIKEVENFLRKYGKTFLFQRDIEGLDAAKVSWIKWNPATQRLEVKFRKGTENVTRPLIEAPWEVRCACIEQAREIRKEAEGGMMKVLLKAHNLRKKGE